MTMTPAERAAHCRKIASSGGRATVDRLSAGHMAMIGRVGFQSAVAAGYGPWLAEHVFHVTLPATYNAAAARARAQARRDRPVLGRCQWPGCPEPASERHHVDGWRVSGDVAALCDGHHTELHRRWRVSRKVWRNRDQITLRAVAISIGIGLDDAIPS